MTVEIDDLMHDKRQVDSDLKNESANLSNARKLLYATEARYSKKDSGYASSLKKSSSSQKELYVGPIMVVT